MTVLELLQKFCGRTGIPVPLLAVGSTDPQVIQLVNLLEEVIEDIVDDTKWSGLTQEATFVTTATEDQGAVATLAPNGFKYILNETLFDRTLRLPLYGPLAAEQWQQLKALPNVGPLYRYRIVGGHLKLSPVPVAGHTIAFEYVSSYAMLAVDGATYRKYPGADTDTFLLPDTLFLAGLRWKWKYEKGLDYAEDFRRFEELRTNASARDATKRIVNLGQAETAPVPGIFISPGSWPLP